MQVLVPELPAVRVHLVLEKLPPETLADQVTVPVGEIAVPVAVSCTVTVNIICSPGVTLSVLGLTLVPVLRLAMVTVAVPLLAECVESLE